MGFDMDESKPKRRWYHLTPDRLILGLFAVQILLLLSEWFQWFGFNEKKGWTVLIAVAAVCVVVVVMLLWLVASFFSRLRFQFSLRSLVVLVVVVAIPFCWLAVKMREAERQFWAVWTIKRADGIVYYDYQNALDRDVYVFGRQDPPAPAWLRTSLGRDFFSEVGAICSGDPERFDDAVLERVRSLKKLRWLFLCDTPVTDVGLENLTGLTELKRVGLTNTQVTDAGLEQLNGLTSLQWLELSGTHVTAQGINRLQAALPNCEIKWDGDTAQ